MAPPVFSLSLISVILFLLLSSNIGTQTFGESNGDDNFFELCQESRCSSSSTTGSGSWSPVIRFPFRLNTQPDFCGLQGFVLSCLNNMTILHLPFSGDFYVQDISYLNSIISVKLQYTNCPIRSVLSFNSSASPFDTTDTFSFSRTFNILNCTERIEFSSRANGIILRPVDCLSYGNNFFYLSDGYASMNKLPSYCRKFKTGKILTSPGYDELEQVIEKLFETGEIFLGWKQLDGCYDCEKSGTFCGLNRTSNATICSTPRPKSK